MTVEYIESYGILKWEKFRSNSQPRTNSLDPQNQVFPLNPSKAEIGAV